jgi:hypothetical protein
VDKLKGKVLSMAAKAVRRDIEAFCLNGDTSSSDVLYALANGWYKTINAVNTYAMTAGALTRAKLLTLSKQLDPEYRATPNMRFITAPNALLDYQGSISDRPTSMGDAGFGFLKPGELPGPGGNVMATAQMPSNLVGGTETRVLYTDLENLAAVFRREMKIKVQEDAPDGNNYIVISLRVVPGVFNSDAGVNGTGITC